MSRRATKPFRWLAYAARWLRWLVGVPGYRMGDTRLDRASKNRIAERWDAKEPKWDG